MQLQIKCKDKLVVKVSHSIWRSVLTETMNYFQIELKCSALEFTFSMEYLIKCHFEVLTKRRNGLKNRWEKMIAHHFKSSSLFHKIQSLKLYQILYYTLHTLFTLTEYCWSFLLVTQTRMCMCWQLYDNLILCDVHPILWHYNATVTIWNEILSWQLWHHVKWYSFQRDSTAFSSSTCTRYFCLPSATICFNISHIFLCNRRIFLFCWQHIKRERKNLFVFDASDTHFRVQNKYSDYNIA